jgi:NOL1/NOP2/fmu family ribosome biogenesis protein
LPESSAQLRAEVADYFETRFGVDACVWSDLRFHERRHEIWATRCLPLSGIASARPPGLRALRRTPDGLKPTSTFLTFLGDRITASRVAVSRASLRAVLLGQRVEGEHADGYVAIVYCHDVIGCGKVRGNRLQAMIPTGRRQELLAALGPDARR